MLTQASESPLLLLNDTCAKHGNGSVCVETAIDGLQI